jgi:tetratricopeptide (TPR) repeat protein
LLIELGEPEDALEQARRVYADDASSALVRQTLAWALMRCAWRGNRHAAMQAKSLIADLEMQSNPRRALLLALRAGAEALVGQAALALESASQALTLDPQNLDAQIACAVASARIGDEGAAKTAYLALSALDEKTRLAIALVLEQLGVDPIREPAERAARTT